MIATGASIEGSLQSDGDIHVEGRVKGSVESAGTLSVGTGGTIVGDVLADEVVVGGRIEGTVIAASQLRMLQTGCIQGDARYGSLEVERGGQIHGRTTPIAIGGASGTPVGRPSSTDDSVMELPAPMSELPAQPAPPPPTPKPAPPAAVVTGPVPEPAAAPLPREITIRTLAPPHEPAGLRDSAPPPLPPSPSTGPGRTRPLPAVRPQDKTTLRPTTGSGTI